MVDTLKTVPGNLSGTLAGVAATFVVGALAHAGYLATAAVFLGQPEATVSLIAMAVIGGLANYAVTHFTALGTLNTLYAALPTVYPEYPGDKPLPEVTTNLTTKDGQPVGE